MKAAGRVTIEPEEFKLVEFDRLELARLIEGLLDATGLDGPLTLEIDQTTPLGAATVVSIDPLKLHVESGALEDPRRIRQLSVGGATNVLGRLLFRVRDRQDPAFGAPPPDAELTLPQSSAWDVYAVGRLIRLGFTHWDERQRRLYQFRTRHGFTDTADAVFDALWTGENLTWADIDRFSTEAQGAAA